MKAFRRTGEYGHPNFINRLKAAFTAMKEELDTRGTTLWAKVEANFARWHLRFTVKSESWHIQDVNISIAGNVVKITASIKSPYSNNCYYPTIAAFTDVPGGYGALGYNIAQDG